MIGPEIHRFLSIGLVLLISSNGIMWGAQVFADNHCDENDDKKCDRSEKNQKSTSKGPVITINPNSGPLATLITVTGNGFDPLSPVVISFKGDTERYSDTKLHWRIRRYIQCSFNFFYWRSYC